MFSTVHLLFCTVDASILRIGNSVLGFTAEVSHFRIRIQAQSSCLLYLIYNSLLFTSHEKM